MKKINHQRLGLNIIVYSMIFMILLFLVIGKIMEEKSRPIDLVDFSELTKLSVNSWTIEKEVPGSWVQSSLAFDAQFLSEHFGKLFNLVVEKGSLINSYSKINNTTLETTFSHRQIIDWKIIEQNDSSNLFLVNEEQELYVEIEDKSLQQFVKSLILLKREN